MKQQRNLTSRKSLNSRNHDLLRRIGLLGISVLTSILILFGLLISFSQTFADDNNIEASQIVSTPTPTATPSSNQFMSMSSMSSGGGPSTEYTTPTIEIGDFVITTTAVFPVISSSDDAGTNPSVSCDENSTSYNEIYVGLCDGAAARVNSGVRFNNVIFPADASLVDAFLEVTVENYSREVPETRIQGEAVADSPTFSSADMPRDRTNRTTAYTLWDTGAEWAGDPGVYRSPSLLTVTQEIMSVTGWQSNNALTYLMEADNDTLPPTPPPPTPPPPPHHRFRSFDYSNASVSPHLVLVYTQTRKTSALQSTLYVEPQTAVADNNDFMTATITLSDTNGILVGKEVTLLATPGPISVTWPYGNTTDANGQAVAQIRSDQAQVSTLSATIVEDQVTLAQTPTITFTDVAISNLSASNDSPAEANEPINFSSDVSTGTNVIYSWDFGDGAAGNVQNPAHSYNAAGVYSAVVTASNSTNSITATTAVTVTNPPADLSLSKTGAANAVAGSSTIYDISVGNLGSLPANNVIVTDTLPISTTFVAQNSPYAYEVDANNGTIVWNVGVLQSGVTETFQLEVEIDPTLTGPITNTIVGSSGGEDGDLENNVREWGLTVSPPPPNADLAVYLSGPGSVPVGFSIEYVLTIQNVGGQVATGVWVTDTLPSEVTFLESTHPTYNTTYYSQTNNVVFGIGTLAPGKSYQITLKGTVASNAQAGITITNHITGTAHVDANSENSTAQKQTDIVAAAPKITVLPPNNGVNPAIYAVAQNAQAPTYVITLTNNGTADLVGGFKIVDKDYNWLSINPSVDNNDLEIGASVTISIDLTDTSQDIGNYYDLLIVEDENGTPLAPIFLRTYIHPEQVDISTTVTNTLSNTVPGAVVTLQKEPDDRVFSVDGVDQDAPPLIYSQTTEESGSTTFADLEIGTYQYTISALGHEPITGTVSFSSSSTNFSPPPLTALPRLVFEPDQAILSVAAGESAHHIVQVRNEGPGYADNFTVQTPKNIPWISSALPPVVPVLGPGEAMSVTLFMHPPESEAGNPPYQEYITVTADNVSPAWLAATINVLDTMTGTVEFMVVDELGLAVSGAEVMVINENGRFVNGTNGPEVVYDTQSATTDMNGRVNLEGLAPGEYKYTVMANGFYRGTGIVTVQPGMPAQGYNRNLIHLATDPFSYQWMVEETSIEDTYAITVEISYHAEVPNPLLFVSYAVFCPGNNIPFMVANLSEVPMENVVLTPSHAGVDFTYEPSGTSTINIGDLPPGAAFTGMLDSSASGSDIADFGQFNVSATYETNIGTLSYNTHSSTIYHCTSILPEIWEWLFDEETNTVIGTYTGNPPEFPTVEGPPISFSENDEESAEFILSGYATLERQAFSAQLNIVADASNYQHEVTDIAVDIVVTDMQGNIIVDGFAVTPTLPTQLGDLNAANPFVSGNWLLVPGELGITDPEGAQYRVKAVINYMYDGTAGQVETVPRVIRVYPQPFIRLDFTHTQPDITGNFYVEVTAQNDGFGLARNLTLDLSDVSTITPLDGDNRSLIFELREAKLNGQLQPLDYVLHFGDMQPGQSATGRWRIAVRASDGAPLINQLVTGFNVSCRHLPFLGLTLSPLIDCNGVFNQYHIVTRDCPFHTEDTCAEVGGPIVTGNGNYTYRQGTPVIPTVGTPLQFTWTYNSINSGIDPGFPVMSSTLGDGWTHNYQMSLDLSRMHTAERTVFVRAPHGTPLNFWVVRDNEFRPAPGIHASLTRSEVAPDRYLYTMTVRNQLTYVFSDTGRLVSQSDAKGLTVEFDYYPQGQLQQVREPISGRFLDFVYDPNGRLITVTDPGDRTTAFGYNPLGHLSTITDTRGQVWQYEYTLVNGQQYLLSHIQDPDGRTVEQTGFDDFGRAITQTFRGQDLEIAYFDDGRRIITDGQGKETLHIYDQQDLLIGRADVINPSGEEPEVNLELYSLDRHYNRTYFQDPNGNPTYYEKTPIGLTTMITDSFTNTMSLAYNDQNNWTQREGWRGDVTLYDYDLQGLLLITQTNHLSDTILYTYNEYGQRTSVTNENEATTEFGYDELGQTIVITDALEHTTHFQYDDIGRLITTTDTMGRVKINEYCNC